MTRIVVSKGYIEIHAKATKTTKVSAKFDRVVL